MKKSTHLHHSLELENLLKFFNDRFFILYSDRENKEFIAKPIGLENTGIKNLNDLNSYYARISDSVNEGNISSQSKLVKEIDDSVSQYLKTYSSISSSKEFSYSLDFLFSINIYKIVRIERLSTPIFNQQNKFIGFRHFHLIKRNKIDYYYPEVFNVIHDDELIAKQIERTILDIISDSIIKNKVLPYAFGDYAYCRAYLKAEDRVATINKCIKKEKDKIKNSIQFTLNIINENRKSKPMAFGTANTYRKGIIAKSKIFAKGNDKWERIIAFMNAYKLL